jgi:tetratricopeptide (TPR) repeat protein
VFDRAILQLAHGLRNVFSFGGAWSEGLILFHRAIEAAQRLDDARAEGWNLYRLGVLHYELGTGGYAEAAQRAREALERLETAGDPRGRGHALRLLGRATRARGRPADAERLLVQAENILAEYGHGDDVAIVRASRADLLRLSARLDEASALYEEVLLVGLEDPVTEANVRKDLGEIALSLDHLEAAQRSFDAAEALAEAAGARAILAHCRLGQARVAHRLQRPARTAELARDAADLFERLGDLDRAYEARGLTH